MVTVCFSETLVPAYECTRCHNAKEHWHLYHCENLNFFICIDQKEIVRVNLLHATSFMQLISLSVTRLIHVTVSRVLYNATDAGFNIAHLFEKCFYVDTDKK
jgi:hypothetical protein